MASAYDKLIDVAQGRLVPSTFHDIDKVDSFGLWGAAEWAAFLTETPRHAEINKYWSLARKREVEKSYHLDLLKDLGVLGVKKAAILFGRIDDEEQIRAIPMLATAEYARSTTDHTLVVREHLLLSADWGSKIHEAPSPALCCGMVYRMRNRDKPVISVDDPGRFLDLEKDGEILDQRYDAIKRLSGQLTLASFCLQNEGSHRIIDGETET